MAEGIYQHEWWAGFGLVVFMTSLICWISIFRGTRRTKNLQQVHTLPGKNSSKEVAYVAHPVGEIRVS
jgi:hypothetical protein